MTSEEAIALDYIARLLAVLAKHGGYSTPEQQATMRGARLLLAERGIVGRDITGGTR